VLVISRGLRQAQGAAELISGKATRVVSRKAAEIAKTTKTLGVRGVLA